MVSITTEYKLASVFQALANGEKDIEISRQVLAERSAFEPYTAFKRLTRLATASLTVYQVVDFLRENDFTVLEKDVRNVFRLYSTSGDGRLSYTDFLELVLPRNNTVLREICTQRESYPVAEDEILPYEVELGLAKIFDKEVNVSRKAELLREDLVARYDFNLRATYELLVEAGEGRVDFDAVYNFLQKNNISVVEKDVIALLRRVDVDRDGRITYSEFCETVLPVDEYYRTLGETGVRVKPAVRVASPTRRVASPTRSTRSRVASPTRSTVTESRYFSPTSKKLTNYDYFTYLSESARKSATLRRSAANSPARTRTESLYQTPTKTRTPASPVRGRSPVRDEVASPMKGNEEEHLATALKEQVELDKELEQAKNKLALQEDFNLFDAFRFFDQTEKGYVTRLQLKEGFNDFHAFPTTNELYLVMKKYNKGADGLLKYSEFCEILKSKDAGYAALLTERKPSYADREDLGFKSFTVELVKRVLTQVIENEYHSEKIRQRLSRRPLFDHYEAFEALDKNRNGFISKDEFRELLADHGFYATQKELKGLIERYDANEDGKVSYTEFVREITPKSPEKI